MRKLMSLLLSMILLITLALPITGTLAEGEVPVETPVVSEAPENPVEEPVAPISEPAPEVTAEPTQEPTAEPTEVATAEPTAEPTEEPTVEPTAEPTEVATEEPTVEPTEVPTEEPVADPTAAPTAEPTSEPTEAPTAAPTAEPTAEPETGLNVSLSIDKNYAMANKDVVTLSASVEGGAAPYTVSFYAMKDSDVTYENVSEQTGEFKIEYEPAEYGKYKLVVSVVDANGLTGKANVTLDVAVSEEEKESDWEKMAEAIDLTGDWRTDLLNFALTQVGYKASTRNFIYNEAGKFRGYTRYGDWFGNKYANWNEMFVCFCMNYIGIDAEYFTYSDDASEIAEGLEYLGAYMNAKGDYEPKPGDLVFFNWKEEEEPKHIGIFVGYVDGGIETIEGDVDDAVVRRTHLYEDKTIVGYANLKTMQDRAEMLERAKNESPVAVVNGVEGLVARTNTDRVNLRAEASTDCEALACLAAAGTKVTVQEAVETDGQVWYKVNAKGLTGYIRYDLVLFDQVPVQEEAPVDVPVSPVQHANEAWNGGESVEIAFSVGAEAAYSWEKNVNGEWVKVEGAESGSLTLDATVENMKYAYRCVANMENGETVVSDEVTLVRADIVQWLNEAEVTQEMLSRAISAKSLDTLVIEADSVIHVRTGDVVAHFDAETGYMIDAVSDLVVARVDMETGMVYAVN